MQTIQHTHTLTYIKYSKYSREIVPRIEGVKTCVRKYIKMTDEKSYISWLEREEKEIIIKAHHEMT